MGNSINVKKYIPTLDDTTFKSKKVVTSNLEKSPSSPSHHSSGGSRDYSITLAPGSGDLLTEKHPNFKKIIQRYMVAYAMSGEYTILKQIQGCVSRLGPDPFGFAKAMLQSMTTDFSGNQNIFDRVKTLKKGLGMGDDPVSQTDFDYSILMDKDVVKDIESIQKQGKNTNDEVVEMSSDQFSSLCLVLVQSCKTYFKDDPTVFDKNVNKMMKNIGGETFIKQGLFDLIDDCDSPNTNSFESNGSQNDSNDLNEIRYEDESPQQKTFVCETFQDMHIRFMLHSIKKINYKKV